MAYDYADLINNMIDAVYFVDKDRRITYWNKAAEKITGFLAEEVVGSHCWDNILIHVDDKGNNLCQGMCPLAAAVMPSDQATMSLDSAPDRRSTGGGLKRRLEGHRRAARPGCQRYPPTLP